MLFAESDELEYGIIIEEDVMIGCGVHFYIDNHRHNQMHIPLIRQGYTDAKQKKLERGYWLGANTIILPGVTIGQNAIVGDGAVVTKSIPAGCIAVGIQQEL